MKDRYEIQVEKIGKYDRIKKKCIVADIIVERHGCLCERK